MSSAGNDGHQSTRSADEVAFQMLTQHKGGEASFLQFAEMLAFNNPTESPPRQEPWWTVQFGGITPEQWKDKALPEGVLPKTADSYGEQCVIKVRKQRVVIRDFLRQPPYMLNVNYGPWITLDDRSVYPTLKVKIVEEEQAMPVAEAAAAAAGAGQAPPELLAAAAGAGAGQVTQTTTMGSSSDDEDKKLALAPKPDLRWQRINGPRQAASSALLKF